MRVSWERARVATADRDAFIRDAMAVMTAWASEPDAGPFMVDTVRGIAEDRAPDDPFEGLLNITGGLITLCGILLVKRAQETGIPVGATLQEFGRRLPG